MKNSKQLPVWMRKRKWSIYIKMNPIMRKSFGVMNFEDFCKMELHSEPYKMTLTFLQNRPKLKG